MKDFSYGNTKVVSNNLTAIGVVIGGKKRSNCKFSKKRLGKMGGSESVLSAEIGT